MCRSTPPHPARREAAPGVRAASGPSSVQCAPEAIRARFPAAGEGDRRPCPAQSFPVSAMPAPTEPRLLHSPQVCAAARADSPRSTARQKRTRKSDDNGLIQLASRPVASLNHKINQTRIPRRFIQLQNNSKARCSSERACQTACRPFGHLWWPGRSVPGRGNRQRAPRRLFLRLHVF